MKQNYFIVVLAHSIHGRLRRIHIPYQVLYVVLGLAVLGCFSVFGFVSSYARMAWKVANYNELRREAEMLRTRYQKLQKVVDQTDEQLATLKLFANEISVAYGIKQKLEGPSDISREGLVPSFTETLEDYNALKNSTFARWDRNSLRRFHTSVRPSIFPVAGILMGSFGRRDDPFSGEGVMHTGVDISAPTGTSVRATADGIVVYASYHGGYGRLVVIDHGSGMQTYYAHLSKFDVVPDQEIRKNEIVGRVGSSGRVTAPHLHYEVRLGGTPVNPYKYMKDTIAQSARRDFPF